MAYYEGKSLAQKIRSRALSSAEATDIAIQMLQGLEHAHSHGIEHRDIKPSNIMITHAGVVKLLDFGIALTSNSSHLTLTGYLLGSLSYMSPEQVKGSVATAQSDIYSVGITLYELLTGVLPITGGTNYEIMLAHMQRVPVPPHEVAPHVPLAISNGAGAASQNDIGTGVIGGMLSATALAIFFVPLFYEIVRGGFGARRREAPRR